MTISSLSKGIIKLNWSDLQIDDFNRIGEYKLGDFNKINTPKGIQTLGNLGVYLNLFTGIYRGGRNEFFMYGIDRENIWYDYDLSGAYATCISILGIPDYRQVEFKDKWTDDELNYYFDKTWKESYGVLKVNFKFPDNSKYPCIPVHLDKSSTIYPLEGENILVSTYELIVARQMGVELSNVSGCIIPFLHKEEEGFVYPFFEIVKIFINERGKYPKQNVINLLWKLINNSIYGQTAIGLNVKLMFDLEQER